jgi:hypothetical protein
MHQATLILHLKGRLEAGDVAMLRLYMIYVKWDNRPCLFALPKPKEIQNKFSLEKNIC